MNSVDQIITTIEKLSKILKYNGLDEKTKKQCTEILKKCNMTAKQNQFKALFEAYLETNISPISDKKETFLCTSDIIESTFGKYKNELSKNPMNGITDLALIIPAFTSRLDEQEIKKAIASCTCAQIKEWGATNLCKSLSAKRKAALD